MEADTRSLTQHFENVEDPRIDRKKLHKLIDIIVITICGVIAGADSFDEIEIFGNAHVDWLKRFLELSNGIPSHDTFERVFRRLNPQEFKDAFLSWTKQLCVVFETTTEQRFYISSLESKVIKKIAHSIRSHWGGDRELPSLRIRRYF